MSEASGLERLLLVAAALSGFIAVAAGAFGAHALSDRLTAEQLDWWETGVRYQLVHAVAMLAAVILARLGGGPQALVAAGFFGAGTVVFSGTLYVMALDGPRMLGAVTPVGGVGLLIGWLVLAVSAWSSFGRG